MPQDPRDDRPSLKYWTFVHWERNEEPYCHEKAEHCVRVMAQWYYVARDRMIEMTRRTKVLFAISGVLFLLFLFFVTDRGQEILRGKIPVGATGFQRDDIYMGAALFPWAYLLIPSLLLILFGLISWWVDRGPKRDRLDR